MAKRIFFQLGVDETFVVFENGSLTFSNIKMFKAQNENFEYLKGAYSNSSILYQTPFPTQTTPLHIAAWSKSSAEVVSTLIQAGANVDALDGNQQSPLHHASNWNPAVVPVLIGAGCKVNLLNKWHSSPLYYAALSGKDRSAVLALLQAGADPHLGKSPLKDSYVSDEMKALIKSKMSGW